MIAVYKCEEWRWLVGLTVELRQGGRRVRVGTVQHAMTDNSALWLAAEGVEKRMLVSPGEGYEIWLEGLLRLAIPFNGRPLPGSCGRRRRRKCARANVCCNALCQPASVEFRFAARVAVLVVSAVNAGCRLLTVCDFSYPASAGVPAGNDQRGCNAGDDQRRG